MTTFKEHEKVESLRIDTLCESIDLMQQDIKQLRENELVHIKTSLTELGTDVAWLMKIQFIVITASVGALISALAGLILKK